MTKNKSFLNWIFPKFKKYIVNFILLFIILILCFSILEVFVRIAFNFSTTEFESNNLYGIQRVSNSTSYHTYPGEDFYTKIEINEFGFRDDPLTSDRLNGDNYKIILLGDSMVEAAQVEKGKRFSEILDEKLESQSNKSVEVFNLGISSTSQMQQYLMLEKMQPIINSNMVIFTILTANDLTDDIYRENSHRPYFVFSNNGSEFEITDFKKYERNFKQGIFKYCRSCVILKRTADNIKFIISGSANTNVPNDWKIYLNNSYFDSEWENKKYTLNLIKKYTDNNNITLIVNIIGGEIDSNYEARKNLESQYPNFKILNPNYEIPKLKILKICEEIQIYCIDSISFLEKNQTESFYFKIDGHLNEKGHEVISSKLFNETKKFIN